MSILRVPLETARLQGETGVLLPVQDRLWCGELHLTACNPLQASTYKASFWLVSLKSNYFYYEIYIIVVIQFYFIILLCSEK